MNADLLDVIQTSNRWVAINKAPGMLSVPGRGPDKQDCVSARLKAMFPQATGPIIVHRLDMETSGIMIFALDADAQRSLSIQFETRKTQKHYIALIEGRAEHLPDSGTINVPIRPDLDNRPYQIIDTQKGKPSKTNWHILARGQDTTRIQFEPITGRTHQLRVHAAAPTTLDNGQPGGLNAPIRGDSLYGNTTRPGSESHGGTTLPSNDSHGDTTLPNNDSHRMMLHATYLAFDDPETHERIEIQSPEPF